MKEIFVLTLTLILIVNSSNTQNNQELKLWYNRPANNWNEALPIGNGRLGAMVFGNPEIEQDWPIYELKYKDENGNDSSMKHPVTFADFAVTEGRFRNHFKKAPPETWNDSMVPIADFLQMKSTERENKFPFVRVLDKVVYHYRGNILTKD